MLIKVESRPEYEEIAVTLQGINDALGLTPKTKEPASMELTEAVAQMQALVKALKNSVESDEAAKVLAKMKLDEVWSSLTKINSENINIPELLAAIEKANEALEKCLEELKDTKERLANNERKRKNIEKENKELRQELATKDAEFKAVEEENYNLIGQVENLSNGLEFPPCWATADGRAQYTFLVAVRDNSLAVSSIYPGSRQEAYYKLVGKDYDNTELSLNGFTEQLSVFYQAAVNSKPECRYFVKVADETSVGAKSEYKQGLQMVESIFYKYLMN
ncbi:hypothetical protein [Lacimicrobium alkaliphilum]|uniref:Uncharacterized protein n=2 Tax=Lacimicrobium alkaliphilum TaxID=1526571 RepID=A0ABQ1RMB6_9ALTE|nr:hypothetical protein [Lacimicrobium alkaliphilum]GGD74684.1 hypothetical protein GCM10011357_32150 [Lacimicrobium alkaliphilum]